jgi:hypothetical protein
VAQPCPTGTTIPGFRFVSSTHTPPRQIAYAWDFPAGAVSGMTYQVLRAESAGYCSGFPPLEVIAETTATSTTVTLETLDRVYEFWVRVRGCDVGAAGAWIDDAGPLGTTGVTEYALPPGDALVPGDTAVLLAPSDVHRFRTSVGLRTLASGATLTFTLRDAVGGVVTRLTENYPGIYYLQGYASDFFGAAVLAGNESVTVEVSAGSAFVYATVADNITNDPSLQIARRLP